MSIESTNKNRPAFVVTADSNIPERIVFLVARLDDLKRPLCLAASLYFCAESKTPGEPPTIDRDYILNCVYPWPQPHDFGIRAFSTNFHFETYPLSDEDVKFFAPYLDAIERLYERR